MYALTQQEMISAALKIAALHEQMIAAKYADLAKFITDPAIQKHLRSFEQTARNHLSLLTQQMQTLGIR